MKKKRILLWSIIFIELIIIGVGSFFIVPKFIDRLNTKEEKEEIQPTIEKEKVTPLVFEVTKDGSDNKMYLFGSIHVADADNLEFPDYLMNAYKNSHYLACEYDITNESEDLDISNYMYQDGSTIKDYIEKDTYDKLVSFLKQKNYYSSYYEYFKPALLTSLLENILYNDAGLDSETGIDMHFINMAKEDNKKVLEVESEKFQTDLLIGLPNRYYELSMKELLDNYDNTIDQLKELYDIWKKGDIDELTDSLLSVVTDEDKEQFTEEDLKLLIDVDKKITDDRNYTMTDRFEEFFNEDKDVLFMVGTAHLIGENGIANQLKQRGYTVVQISK